MSRLSVTAWKRHLAMTGANTITRLADYRTASLAPAPIFFASRLIAEGRHTKVVEYCILDIDGAVKLMVTVTWNAEPLRPGDWTPSSSALAAVLLIGQMFEREVVVVAHDLEDDVLQPLRPGAHDPKFVEMRDVLSRRDLRQRTPDLDDQIALLRYDPARPESAYGDALLLRLYWDFVQGCLGEQAPMTVQSRTVADTTVSAVSRRTARKSVRLNVPAWAWGLGAALVVQLLALGAPWLFPTG